MTCNDCKHRDTDTCPYSWIDDDEPCDYFKEEK